MRSPRPVIYIKFGDDYTSTDGEKQERDGYSVNAGGRVDTTLQREALLCVYISVL